MGYKCVQETYLGGRDGGDNEVEGAGVVLGPVGIVIGGDVGISAELQSILLLVVLARDGNDLVGAKGLGEHDTEVTETTNTNDTDTLAGSAAVVFQGRVHGDTTAEHGRSLGGGDGVGDLNDETRGRAVVQGVTAIGLAAVLVDAVVGANHGVAAVLLKTRGALLAVTVAAAARVALSTNTNTVSNLDITLGLGTNANSDTDDFVTDTAGVHGGALHLVSLQSKDGVNEHAYPTASESVQVGSADTAVGDLDVNIGLLPGLGLELLPDHVADGVLVKAHPALELVIGSSHFD